MAKILIIDDEPDMQETLRSILKKKHSPSVASSGNEGIKQFKSGNFDLVISDLKMPGMDGIEVLNKVREIDPTTPLIMVTASKDIKSAVEAMKAGAEDYLSKPFEVDELLAIVGKALEKKQLSRENQALREIIKDSETYCDIIGKSSRIKKVIELIDSVAKTDSSILITGESGSGKEIAAKAVHKMSTRAKRPFIAINCAAIPENLLESELFGHERGAFTGALERRIGKFELADGGTIFLDEIGCMSPAMQAKLLRVLEDRTIDRIGGSAPVKIEVRIVSATNIDFKKYIAEGKFREDLFYRLNVIPIEMPPLRERKEDLPYFISYFLDKLNKDMHKSIKGLSPGAQALLDTYDFPGNVREFKNILERAVALTKGDVISEEHLLGLSSTAAKPQVYEKMDLKNACEQFERSFIMDAIKKAGGNKTKASEILGVARTTLASKLESLDIN